MTQLVQAGVRTSTQYTSLRNDGTTVPVEASSAVIRDCTGQPKAAMALIRDISQRKTAEEALQTSEERFRVAFDEAPVGKMIAVGEGTITRVNRALCRMSGYAQEELVGKHVRDITHPADQELSGKLSKQLLPGRFPASPSRNGTLPNMASPLGPDDSRSSP